MSDGFRHLFSRRNWPLTSSGPLYQQLKRQLLSAISSGYLTQEHALPSERDLAEMAGVSRVTVRKAVSELVREGILVQKQGSGTYIAPQVERVEQSLSVLTSFTEDMARRGKKVTSRWLKRETTYPSPQETMALGLPSGTKVTRLMRLRMADGIPLAIEQASLSEIYLPEPNLIDDSLYEYLDEKGIHPERAVQRISATTMTEEQARLLEVPRGSAALKIERISFLPSGKTVEFTCSTYRGDAYDFVAELRLHAHNEQ